MGGKGRKRREKNYRAAHGGHSRLPPPPTSSSLDAMPSKLRKLVSLSTSSHPGSGKVSLNIQEKDKEGGRGSAVDKKDRSEVQSESKITEIEREIDEAHRLLQDTNDGQIVEDSTHEKKKGKKKRKRVDDLRFPEEELAGFGSRRRERKKKRLEAMKKKHKKVKPEEDLGFPGQEKIKFGDIVEAPPKLVTVPKAPKTTQGASHERLRVQAVEAYRSRKGWASRPGINLMPPVLTTPSL